MKVHGESEYAEEGEKETLNPSPKALHSLKLREPPQDIPDIGENFEEVSKQ